MKKISSAIKILLFAAVVAAVFICSLFRGVDVETSFFSIFPEWGFLADVNSRISRNVSAKVSILVEADDFKCAKAGAEAFYKEFNESGIFKKLELRQDAAQMLELRDFLFRYRYQLFDSDADPDEIAAAALAAAYSPFSFADFDRLSEDPFLISALSFKKYAMLSAGNLFIKDGFLTCQKGGLCYVLIRGELPDVSFSKNKGVGQVLEYSRPGVRYICSGVPFHSWESSSSAKREIAWITTASLFAVAAILLCSFRSVIPMLVSMLNIAISLLFGLASVVAVFGKINILAFVFGTTLIGVSIDYSIHFFARHRSIVKSLTVNCISTEISWIALMLAPFPLLRQIALFSAAGLLCSYFIVILIYPRLKIGIAQPAAEVDKGVCHAEGCRPCRYKRYSRILMLLFCFGIAAAGGIRIKNDVGGMYRMSGRMMKFEKKAASVIGLNGGGEYYLVSGTGPQELLAHEEELVAFLGGRCSAITKFIPSVARQKENYAAASVLLERSPAQLEALGFDRGAGADFADAYKEAATLAITPENAPFFVRDLFDFLYLGRSGDRYYSVVFPAGEHGVFTGENVILINNVREMEKALDRLSRTILIFILISYLVALPVIFVVYGRSAARIAAVLAAVILCSLAFVSSLYGGVDFFACSGIVLVFGLGLDYLVYSLDGKSGRATFLSFVTTELSFGALALSTFTPVRTFGLTVFAGLILAYLFYKIYHADP